MTDMLGNQILVGDQVTIIYTGSKALATAEVNSITPKGITVLYTSICKLIGNDPMTAKYENIQYKYKNIYGDITGKTLSRLRSQFMKIT